MSGIQQHWSLGNIRLGIRKTSNWALQAVLTYDNSPVISSPNLFWVLLSRDLKNPDCGGEEGKSSVGCGPSGHWRQSNLVVLVVLIPITTAESGCPSVRGAKPAQPSPCMLRLSGFTNFMLFVDQRCQKRSWRTDSGELSAVTNKFIGCSLLCAENLPTTMHMGMKPVHSVPIKRK